MGDHTESFELEFDPKIISYAGILKLFFESHTPHSTGSRQYRSAIFYHGEEQKKAAQQAAKDYEKRTGRKCDCAIEEAGPFYLAENYHQKYLLRQNRDILKSLNLSDSDLIHSHIATRLNGYVAGHGSLKQLEGEIDSFGLSEPIKKQLTQIVKSSSAYHCG